MVGLAATIAYVELFQFCHYSLVAEYADQANVPHTWVLPIHVYCLTTASTRSSADLLPQQGADDIVSRKSKTKILYLDRQQWLSWSQPHLPCICHATMRQALVWNYHASGKRHFNLLRRLWWLLSSTDSHDSVDVYLLSERNMSPFVAWSCDLDHLLENDL